MEFSQKVIEAEKLAKSVHENHFRLSGENYLDHIHRVVDLLVKNNISNENLLICAFLHHSYKVKPGIKDTIKTKFGDEIVKFLDCYANISKLEANFANATNVDKSIIIKSFFNVSDDPNVLLLRIVCKADNIRDIFYLSREEAVKAAERSVEIYAPIARLLGLFSFVQTLEDNSLKILHTGEYFTIKDYLDDHYKLIVKEITDARDVLTQLLSESNIDCKIKYRIKSVNSIFQKSIKYNIPVKKENMSKFKDIAAMRILVNTVDECYLVEDMLKKLWDFLPNERNDYIIKPKLSGYKSIHNAFKLGKDLIVEIQIRTFDMHNENEFGRASHAFYKMGDNLRKNIEDNPEWLREVNLFEGGPSKIDQFSDYVYVFTPKGEIKELNRGANIIDFAYLIHEELGNSCVGAVVNNLYVPISYVLKNGDVVEVKTSGNKKKPSKDWLNIATTRAARYHIRKSLREIKQ